MIRAGIIAENERIELIGGEVVPMSAKGSHHESVKAALNRFWVPVLSDDVSYITETTLWIGDRDFLEPDFVFWPRTVAIKDLSISVIQLLVEAADSSLAYDRGRKATIYAKLGLREYWVIDAVQLTTRVHRDPVGDTFASIEDCAPGDLLSPRELPALAVRLSGLELR